MILDSNETFEPLLLGAILRADRFILAGPKPAKQKKKGFTVKDIHHRLTEKQPQSSISFEEADLTQAVAIRQEQRRPSKIQLLDCRVGEEEKTMLDIRKNSGIFKHVKLISPLEDSPIQGSRAVDWGIINCNKIKNFSEIPIGKLVGLVKQIREKVYFLADMELEEHASIDSYLKEIG